MYFRVVETIGFTGNGIIINSGEDSYVLGFQPFSHCARATVNVNCIELTSYGHAIFLLYRLSLNFAQ